MPCAVLQAEDSKGISAVIQWREAHSSREVPEGTKLLSFTLCRSLYLHIAKKRIPNCLTGVCTGSQLEKRGLNASSPSLSLSKRHSLMWLRGGRGNEERLVMGHDQCGCAAVSCAGCH